MELHREIVLILQALQTALAREELHIQGIKAHCKVRRLLAQLPLLLRDLGLSLPHLIPHALLLAGLIRVCQPVQPLHRHLRVLMKVPGERRRD